VCVLLILPIIREIQFHCRFVPLYFGN
jgi:hypothetical protein